MTDPHSLLSPANLHTPCESARSAHGEQSRARLAPDWPHREFSLFPTTGHVRWHVQVMGAGPVLLLLHGTGSANHSWRDLAPLLAQNFRVIAPDLPGHGASIVDNGARLSLTGMVADLESLLTALGVAPSVLVGHSAGAAIAVRMAAAGRVPVRTVISLNGALLPFGGVVAHLFSPAAKLLARGSWMARAFAWRARRPSVLARLLDSTGSRLDAHGRALYAGLAGDARHVSGALTMMANWDLSGMARDLSALTVPLNLVVGSADAMIPPAQAAHVAARSPRATMTPMIGYGHLAHEEDPATVARIIEADARACGVLPAEDGVRGS